LATGWRTNTPIKGSWPKISPSTAKAWAT
jgi:hypothetical protein